MYYLIEHYHTDAKRVTWDQQIDTALSSTQVVDGFIVKETKHIQDTIAYLTVIHQTIVKVHEVCLPLFINSHRPPRSSLGKFQNRDIHVIPDDHIRRHSYIALQKHLRKTEVEKTYATSYKTFQTLNAKSGQDTLKECWARMLLCVNGLSAEKVAALIELYDTPKAMNDAFIEAEAIEEDEREREEMMEEGGKGKGRRKKSLVPLAKHLLTRMTGDVGGRRKVGTSLSEKIYYLFRAKEYVNEE